jgi:hypothetical protein
VEIKRIVEVLVILATLVVILYCLPFAAFKTAAYVLFVVWVAEIVVFAPMFIKVLLDKNEGGVAK